MTVYVDRPLWRRHDRLWAHLISDTSVQELHTFARTLGIPERAFDRDHYDIPEELVAPAIAQGAVQVGSKELLKRLVQSGLRRRR